MTRLALALLMALVAAPPAAAQGELTGTAYTVLYRGRVPGAGMAPLPRPDPYQRNRMGLPLRTELAPGSDPMLRLIDAGARREVARAEYDARLGGYLFSLPFDTANAGTERCLALLTPNNLYVVVRPASGRDTGAAFRNPAWDAESGRVAELAALKSERENVYGQAQAVTREIAQLQAESGLPPGAKPEQCPTPPTPPEPPRPATAVDPQEAAAIAGPACALRWERDHGERVNLGRIFSDSGVANDWQQRARGASLLERLPELRVPIAAADLAVVADAAAKGRAYLEHGDGVRLFSRAHAACREQAVRLSEASMQAWERAKAEAREAPQRAHLQCTQRLTRIAQLQAAQGNTPAYLAALDRRIAQRAEPPPASDPVPLHLQSCQP